MCPQRIGQIHPVVRNHADDFGNTLADSFCNREVDAVVDIAGVQVCRAVSWRYRDLRQLPHLLSPTLYRRRPERVQSSFIA